MNKSDFIETIDRANLTEQTNIRLNKIIKIEIIFIKKLIKENQAVKN